MTAPGTVTLNLGIALHDDLQHAYGIMTEGEADTYDLDDLDAEDLAAMERDRAIFAALNRDAWNALTLPLAQAVAVVREAVQRSDMDGWTAAMTQGLNRAMFAIGALAPYSDETVTLGGRERPIIIAGERYEFARWPEVAS